MANSSKVASSPAKSAANSVNGTPRKEAKLAACPAAICSTASPSKTQNEFECFWNMVHVSKHPVVQTKINRMRRKDTDSKLFRELMYEVGTFLAYEATQDLSLTDPKTLWTEAGNGHVLKAL
jgi:hypothetical protein